MLRILRPMLTGVNSINMINEEFIRQWLTHQEETLDKDDPDNHWTDEHLIDLSISDGGDAELWQFVLNAYQREMSDGVLAVLAAGPLEDVLAKNGEAYIDQVEELARKDPKFKKILGGVWQNAMSEALWARVCAVRGESW